MQKPLHAAPFFTFLLLTWVLLPCLTLQAQGFTDAGSYITYIGEQHREIMKDMLNYSSAVAHGKSARKVENRRKEMIQTVSEVRKKIVTMPPFKGDKSLRDSSARFLLTSYHILNDDYGKVVDLEEVAEQSYDAMEAYLLAQDMASDKLNEASVSLQNTEKNFAAQHSVQLIETSDELSKKFIEAGKVNAYHRIVYLIFFRSYKQEMYLLDAIEKKNINAIEQNKNTLLKYAEEGITKLSSTPAFNGDQSLVNICRQMQEFYRSECKDKLAILTNYYLKEENFTKIKKAFEAKREKERTQADVNQVNKAADELNKAASDFNQANKQLFDSRKQLLDSWNKNSQQFMDKHVPKYYKKSGRE